MASCLDSTANQGKIQMCQSTRPNRENSQKTLLILSETWVGFLMPTNFRAFEIVTLLSQTSS
jgi:hypothetical protein